MPLKIRFQNINFYNFDILFYMIILHLPIRLPFWEKDFSQISYLWKIYLSVICIVTRTSKSFQYIFL